MKDISLWRSFTYSLGLLTLLMGVIGGYDKQLFHKELIVSILLMLVFFSVCFLVIILSIWLIFNIRSGHNETES